MRGQCCTETANVHGVCWGVPVEGTCATYNRAFPLPSSAGDDVGFCGDSEVAEGPRRGTACDFAVPASVSSASSVWLGPQAGGCEVTAARWNRQSPPAFLSN